jgi:drug/metabolite transporter (DMT)-like permease
MVLEIGVFVWALRFVPLADVHSIAAAAPLVVVALAGPILGEKVGWHRWAAVLAGFAGVLIIMRPGFRELDVTVVLPLVATVLWGLLQLTSRLIGRYDGPNTTLFYSTTVAMVVSVAIGPWDWTSPDAVGWAWLLAASVAGAGAHYTLIRAMDAAEASMMQPFSYTLVVWATLMGWLAFGEFPDNWTIAGGVVIVLAGLYAMHRERSAMLRARAGISSTD